MPRKFSLFPRAYLDTLFAFPRGSFAYKIYYLMLNEGGLKQPAVRFFGNLFSAVSQFLHRTTQNFKVVSAAFVVTFFVQLPGPGALYKKTRKLPVPPRLQMVSAFPTAHTENGPRDTEIHFAVAETGGSWCQSQSQSQPQSRFRSRSRAWLGLALQ